jgi:hypothetical protein
MARVQVGERVGAVAYSGNGVAAIYGYGVFEGDTVPPKNRPGPAAMLGQLDIPNPTIKLDSGQTVYGCECWWGPEDAVKKSIADCEIVTKDIDKELEQLKELQNG